MAAREQCRILCTKYLTGKNLLLLTQGWAEYIQHTHALVGTLLPGQDTCYDCVKLCMYYNKYEHQNKKLKRQMPHTRTHSSICTSHAHANVHIDTYMHICTLHAYIHTYMHACIHTYIHTNTCIHAHTHVYMHTNMYTYIHTYINTYIHKYIQVHSLGACAPHVEAASRQDDCMEGKERLKTLCVIATWLVHANDVARAHPWQSLTVMLSCTYVHLHKSMWICTYTRVCESAADKSPQCDLFFLRMHAKGVIKSRMFQDIKLMLILLRCKNHVGYLGELRKSYIINVCVCVCVFVCTCFHMFQTGKGEGRGGGIIGRTSNKKWLKASLPLPGVKAYIIALHVAA